MSLFRNQQRRPCTAPLFPGSASGVSDCELIPALNYVSRLTYRRDRDDPVQLGIRRLAPQSSNSSRETILGNACHFLELGSVFDMSDDVISDMRDLENLASWRRVLLSRSQDQHGLRD
jgi:hypothetical protein